MAIARRWRGSEPPWPQAAANTNQPVIVFQENHPGRFRVPPIRRGKWFSPGLGQAAANTNQPVIVSLTRMPRRIKLPRQRQGHVFSPGWGQAAANTNQPVITFQVNHPGRFRFPPIRRGKSAFWPLFQAAANTNQPTITFVGGERRNPRVPPIRRGKVVSPPWAQQAAAVVSFVPTVPPTRRRFAGLRRAKVFAAPLAQDQPLASARTSNESRFFLLRRAVRSRVLPTSQDPAPIFSASPRRTIRLAARRTRMALPPWGQADPSTNQPTITFSLSPRRALRLLLRRGRMATVPATQAAAAPPSIVLSASQRRTLRTGAVRRSHSFERVPDQVVATAPAWVPAPWRGYRFKALHARRRRAAETVTTATLVAPPINVAKPQRIRPWRMARGKRGRYFQPPWIGNLAPILTPTILLAVTGISRAMSAVGRSRAMTVVGMSRLAMTAVGRSRAMVVTGISRIMNVTGRTR